MKNHSFNITVVAVLLTVPALTSADQNEVKRAPYQENLKHADPKTIPYVDQILIDVVPEYEPAFGKPLRSELIQRISELAEVRLIYVRNGGGYHLFQLPKKGYEAEAEALCEKIRQDKRIKVVSSRLHGTRLLRHRPK